MHAHIAARLARHLSLTAAQSEEVRLIVGRRQQALTDLRRDIHPRVEFELSELEEEIAVVLNDEQRVRWRALAGHLRSRWLHGDLSEIAKPSTARPRFEFHRKRRPIGHLAARSQLFEHGFPHDVDRCCDLDVPVECERFNGGCRRGCHQGVSLQLWLNAGGGACRRFYGALFFAGFGAWAARSLAVRSARSLIRSSC